MKIRYLSLIAATLLPATNLRAEENTAANRPTPDLPARWLQQMDANQDGKLAKSETSGIMLRFFDRNDTDKDGFISDGELRDLAGRLGKRMANRTPRPGNSGTALPSVPDDVEVVADIGYREGDSQAWKLDLVTPKEKAKEPRPGLVFVHGGGWRNGDKRAGTFFNGAVEYAQKGYVCITVNYRLTGEAPFPACIEDVKCAVRWFRAHAGEYGVDPERIGGYGNSAGAHLVAMLGLAKKGAGLEGDGPWQDQSSLIQSVCASATPTDFSLFQNSKNNRDRFKNENYDDAELSKLSSPINHVSADAPPFLLIHGTADTTVNVKHSDSFVEALKKAGNEDITYIRVDGAGHGVYNQNRDETHPAMEKFFARTLGR
ncbi:MAG: alpha/beta hydrolase fold domain-containing protein [Verrucomicrobiales bacterium]|nr:alpha/beta hydrolase fold domain-containing protein [Verrucomicrobiales bacterium]